MNSEFRFVSIVKNTWRVLPGRLTAAIVNQCCLDMRRTIERLGIKVYVGGWDISANYDAWNSYEWHYQLQSAGIGWCSDWTPIDAARTVVLPSTADVPRPYKAQIWDWNKRAIEYCVKPNFFGREQYVDTNPKRTDRGPSLNTRSRKLRVPERIEVLAMLDAIGFGSRHIFRGARFVHTESGPRIVLDASGRPIGLQLKSKPPD